MDRKLTSNSLKQTFDRRSFVIGSVQGGIGVLLAARMGYIAVAENEKYEMEAESNRVNLSLIPPRRGWILDRNGSPLASNRADFRVDVIPERVVDIDATVETLGELLEFSEPEKADLRDRMQDSAGFSAVAVANGLDYEKFAAVSVRIPELPGVIPQRGYSRFYPTGPSVGHLLGYVGTPSREEYDENPQPLLLTPGFKLGKDGIEKEFEQKLRGVPGARRVEVTASGRIVRDLETREDTQGDAVQLTIDGPLQDYAARRLGLESGSVVVMDCLSGDLLCMASMPSFDPNSFSDGIGRVEFGMLRDNERVPLRNKTLKGLYPPGSTVKPMHSMAFMHEGVSPSETIVCGGGRRIGNRFFNCWSNHGVVDMAKAVYQSCDSYYYHFAQQVGFDKVAAYARRFGLGQEFDLPVASQFYGTVPDPQWKLEKYGQEWQPYDTVNASIGQGYYLASPLQLAVMSARIATGRNVAPALIKSEQKRPFASLDFRDDEISYIRQAMSDVVNGPGTAGRARLPLENVLLAGKTGTAQVVSLRYSDGKSGPWQFRDHGLFVFFAPFDNPRYAGAVVIEHGGGSGAAYPVARDVMTFLLDPQKGLDALHALEEQWGGTAQERLDRQYQAYAAAAGVDLPPAPPPVTLAEQVDAEARAAYSGPEEADSTVFSPRDEANPRSEGAST
ncbi:penicillin-binding protein 2 [Aurantiacibacter poecillastricola]|uniref:penicillin-binding protein 2 n=1 Tax=Aurantiacibacter poecillastricola TaxID=3064385 RepID=UPI00273FE575|nr:penicillin-binding protein 2 [Aurantiacibacter sp. 219JJ12-13]MDP5261966.1 penicillin-binding protein 2 [Aurantiacibacter sp. 219JJ12-13]